MSSCLATPIAGLTASNRDACPGPLTSLSRSQSAAPHKSLRTPLLPPSLVFLLLLLLPAAAFSQSVTTQQYTNARIGIQSQETLLTPSNVSASSFGKLFSLPVSGHVYAQPLYVPALTVNNPSATPSFVISQPITATPGTHYVVLVGYPSTGGSVSAAETITVQ